MPTQVRPSPPRRPTHCCEGHHAAELPSAQHAHKGRPRQAIFTEVGVQRTEVGCWVECSGWLLPNRWDVTVVGTGDEGYLTEVPSSTEDITTSGEWLVEQSLAEREGGSRWFKSRRPCPLTQHFLGELLMPTGQPFFTLCPEFMRVDCIIGRLFDGGRLLRCCTGC